MSRTHHLLELDPAVVRRARSLARQAAAPVVKIAQQPHDRLGRARDAAPRRPRRRRPRARAVGQPPRHRRARRGRPRARRHDAGLRRPAPWRGPRPHDARPEGRERQRVLPAADRPRGHGGPSRGDEGRRRRPAHDRPLPRHARPPRQAPRRPEDEAVDLPHRRDRRHLRGHPAGPGRRARGRRRHRRHPLDRAVAARLRARRGPRARASPAPTRRRRTSGSCAPRSTT